MSQNVTKAQNMLPQNSPKKPVYFSFNLFQQVLLSVAKCRFQAFLSYKGSSYCCCDVNNTTHTTTNNTGQWGDCGFDSWYVAVTVKRKNFIVHDTTTSRAPPVNDQSVVCIVFITFLSPQHTWSLKWNCAKKYYQVEGTKFSQWKTNEKSWIQRSGLNSIQI